VTITLENKANDAIFAHFLERQVVEGLELAAQSDLLRLHVLPQAPPHFVAEFFCKGLVRDQGGAIREHDRWDVGIWFPPDYMRRVDPFDVLRIFTPDCWHPNISRELPLVCVGRLAPGTGLVDILYQVYEVLTYQKYNPRENDSLNPLACAWARENQHRFPVDRRPLKRRKLGSLEARPA